MALALLIVFSFFHEIAFAGAEIKLKSYLEGSPCKEKVETLVQKWASSYPWRVEFENKNRPLVIKSPTKKIGAWIVLEKNEKTNQITATRMTANSRLIVTWNGSCENVLHNVVVGKNSSESSSKLPSFDDSDLEKLLSKRNAGLIYAFSPYMHLSVEGLEPISKLAKDLNLDLTILVDPLTVNRYPWKNIKHQNYPIMSQQSFELLMRGLGIHYPVVIAYNKEGKLSGVYPGRKSDGEYKNFLREFFQ